VLECVINISEGSRTDVVEGIAAAAGSDLLDVHTDAHHNRSVLTLVGEGAPRAVAEATVRALDIGAHAGVHPRIGVVDVVPFVPLEGATLADAVAARDRFAQWIAQELGVPAFLYGENRTLPNVRKHAFGEISPDYGPGAPHPRAGAVAVGARPPLIAWNVYLAASTSVPDDLAEAKRIASLIRGPSLRALGLQVGDEVQVSMNLVAPHELGPAEAWDLIASHRMIDRSELVGLVPRSVVDWTPSNRWSQLDLDPERTIEARLAEAGAASY
jgi:glutamate formiminotransferase